MLLECKNVAICCIEHGENSVEWQSSFLEDTSSSAKRSIAKNSSSLYVFSSQSRFIYTQKHPEVFFKTVVGSTLSH